MSAFIYILEDNNGKFYIGSTDNLERRIHQHELGHTQTTRNMAQPKIVFYQEYGDLEKARGVERKLKMLKRKDYIRKIILDGYIKITPP